jgi:hypothetical protein
MDADETSRDDASNMMLNHLLKGIKSKNEFIVKKMKEAMKKGYISKLLLLLFRLLLFGFHKK